MKKLIAIFFAICLIGLASCTTTLYGDYGIVTSVELNMKYSAESRRYTYLVWVKHPSSTMNYYQIKTSRLYQVGDTIVIAGKKYR